MGTSKHLRVREVESVFALVNECRELWADTDAWQEHLVRGACRLTGTAVGQYNEQRLAPDLQSTEILDETDGGAWRDAGARARLFRMYTDHPNRAAFFPRCAQLAGAALGGGEAVALRPHIRCDAEWYHSFVFNEYCRPAGIDGFVMSFALNPVTGSLVMVTTMQDMADPAPTPRAAAVLSLLTRQVAPLVGTALATNAQYGLRGLSPRLRQTLDALLNGDSEKQIAERMGIQRATVHEYVGALYQRFHVGSRGELMAYFLRRQPMPAYGRLGPALSSNLAALRAS
jgi:DNA-binding CsgD family transcriptional regulator